MPTFRKAKATDVDAIVDLLAEVFCDYPVFELMIENAADRAERTREIQKLDTLAYMKKHSCFVGLDGDRVVAVALLREKARPAPGMIDYIRCGALRLLFRYGPLFAARVLAIQGRLEGGCRDVAKNSWYLEELAVSKAYQGRRIGSAMLRECIEAYICAHGGGNLFLATNTQSNRVFYSKNGFTEFDQRLTSYRGKSIKTWSFKKQLHRQYTTGGCSYAR